EGARAGREAWDHLRAAWTHDYFIRGGRIDTFAQRAARLDPEFQSIMFGDGSGKQVFDNLTRISQALEDGKAGLAGAGRGGERATAQGKAIVGRSAERLGRTRETAAAANEAARLATARESEAGQMARLQAAEDLTTTRRTVQAGKAETAEEARFRKSSLSE